MRTKDSAPPSMWTMVTTEDLVPADHPLRPLRKLVNDALAELSPKFSKLYASRGRPSIAPEKQMRALLLQMLYSIRSERMLMEQMRYNMLFRWFVGLTIDERVWDVTVFTKNRERFLNGDIATKFFEVVVRQARDAGLLSDEHFTVDGTLVEAWAGQKSVKPINNDEEPPAAGGGRNPDVDFKGTKRTNETHRSTTDPDARLYRKSNRVGAQLGYLGHALMENRNGLVVSGRLTRASGSAEREAALDMIEQIGGTRPLTLGADKGYDAAEFVAKLRECNVTPHIAQNTSRRRSAIDGRTTRHEGYAISQRKRKRVEEIFGWAKTIAGLRKVRFRGLPRVRAAFMFGLAAFNLIRMRNLVGACT